MAGEDETGLNRGQRQPLFYPAEGVQPRGGFVRQLAVYQRGIALRQVAYRANAGVIPLRVKEVDKQNVRAQGGRPPGARLPFQLSVCSSSITSCCGSLPGDIKGKVFAGGQAGGSQQVTVRRKTIGQRADLG